MSYFRSLFRGSANGSVPNVQANPGIRRIENHCRHLGLPIGERFDDTGLVLHCKDLLAGIRPVLVTVSTNGDLAVFSAFSTTQFPRNQLPPSLAGHLLLRNSSGSFFSWRMSEDDAGNVRFAVAYIALLGGLDPPHLKVLCEGMCNEINEFESHLRQTGLM